MDMCGLCGFTGEIIDRDAVLENMTEVITHRGPDSKGFYTDEDISMGFRRLSIIDLDHGSQPIYNEDKTLVLMFNGEIYNYQQLRRELVEKGHRFATDTDSEVLVHGFEEWPFGTGWTSPCSSPEIFLASNPCTIPRWGTTSSMPPRSKAF